MADTAMSRTRACAGGGDRVRVRRARGRRAAAARGGHRLRRPGAGRQRRRHLAGQQLSGLRLRRAVPPVLVLLRAQPRLAAHLLRAGAHPRLPGARHRRLPAAAAPPLQLRGEEDDAGTPSGCAGRSRPAAGTSPPTSSSPPPGRSPTRRSRTIPGLDTFPGKVFHSARWDHDYDLRGKRVAMVGTGASAIQIVPAIQPEVARLTLFQRTPPWVLPRVDRAISGAERWLHRQLPFTAQAAARTAVGHPGAAGPGVHQAPGRARPRRAVGQAQHGPRHQGPGAARQADPRLPHRLQADPAVQRRTTRRSPGPMWTWSPPG